MHEILNKINRSTLKLLEAHNLPQLCGIILDEIIKVTNIDTGVMFMMENGKLNMVSSKGIKEKVVLSKNDKIYDISNKGKIIISVKNECSRFNYIKNLKQCYPLYLPIFHDREPIGIIILFSGKPVSFDNKYISLLQLFTTTAAIAMKKTQLHLQVQNALDTRDRFIALASHELRTPLTSLNGYVQLLYKKLAGKNTTESRWIEELYLECTRLMHLIKELLDINRIKQGELEFILHEVDIPELLKIAIERFRFLNKDHEIIYKNGLTNGKGRIIGDFEKLLQMLNALIGNAAKFSPPGSKINISVENNQRFITLKVKDRGSGIPEKEIKRIFDGFYKIGKDEIEGMGVGLMLSEHIIKQHKGKISITSAENKGTEIKVQFPRLKMF